MIPAGARVFVATRPVDFRKGPESVIALVKDRGADPSQVRSTSSAPSGRTG